MERTSGLKECPGCGLRNRLGATQCDFCGWDFKEESDDWMGKVSDLEKLSKESSTDEIDRITRSKIELTMAKPSEALLKEKAPEAPAETPTETLTASPDEQGETAVLEATVPTEVQVEAPADPLVEEHVETKVEEAPPIAPSIEITAVEPTIPEPVTEVKHDSEVKSEPEPSLAAEERTASVPMEKSESPMATGPIITYGVLGTGAALYAVDLYLVTSHIVDKVAGWAIVIVASALIAAGIMRLLPRFDVKEEKEEEIIICPACHEVVGESVPQCPSCGANFQTAPRRE